MTQKIEDLTSQLDNLLNKNDEKFKVMRDEFLEDCREKVNYAREEKRIIEEKMEKLKK